MKYRREIDGLRAIAVMSVIFFHAGFQGFSGGFVGVDIFFVISGYLITSIILAEKQSGTFSLIGFYERRAKRILPALFFVLFACLPFAWILLFPTDLKQFSESLVSVSTFLSNVYFWKNSFYFDTAAELKPLLHTWSLAVEEQYYVLFPIFILLTWKLNKRWVVGMLIAITLISLAAAEWGSFNALSLSFYLLPTRAWELLIGVLLSFYLFERKPDHSFAIKHHQLISLAGLALIAYAIVSFDKQTPFPSLYGLIPTIGAGLIILAGTEHTLVGRVLGSKPLVGIGLISYSAYLWHQPLFVFARHESIDEPSKLLLAALAVVTLVFAYLSWKYIETPFRKKDFDTKRVFSYSLAGSLFFISAGVALPLLKDPYSGFTPDQKNIYSYMSYNFNAKARKDQCFLDSSAQSYESFSSVCKNVVKNKPTLLLWGDSHAAAMSIGLRPLLKNVVQYTSSNCPPILGINLPGARYCQGINDFIFKEIERLHPDEIILQAYWYTYGARKLAGLGETIASIQNISPASHVTIVGNVPLWPDSLPVLLLKQNVSLDGDVYLHLPLYADLKLQDERLKFVADANNIAFVSALDAFCLGDKCKAITSFGGASAPTAFDYGHLTEAGSVLLAQAMLTQSDLENKHHYRSLIFTEVKERDSATPFSSKSHRNKSTHF